MSSQPPYWGELPTPKGAMETKARRVSAEYSQTETGLSLNRASVQTTKSANTDAPSESTFGTYGSPSAASFAGSGLAPRPPSLPYGANIYPQDLLDKRAKRASRNRETAPPTALDMPSVPLTNYHHPQGNDSFQTTSRSSRRSSGFENEYYQEQDPESTKNDYPVLDRNRKTFESHGNSRRPSASGGPARRPSQRSGGDGRRGYANDHSPLQKLEMTLDSITKEEKRARMEAAEQKARERVQRGQVPQQVRFSDCYPPAQPDTKRAPPPQSLQTFPTAPTQSIPARPLPEPVSQEIDVSHDPITTQTRSGHTTGPLPQHLTDNREEVGMSVSQARVSEISEQTKGPIRDFQNSGIKRNLSFRERAAAQNEMILPGMEELSVASTPPEETRPSASEHRRTFSLTRSGSNKLKKSPPKSNEKGTKTDVPKTNVDMNDTQLAKGGLLQQKLQPGDAVAPGSARDMQNTPTRREAKSESPIIPPVVNKLTKSPYGSQRRHSQDILPPTIRRVTPQQDSPPPQRSISNRFGSSSAVMTAPAAVSSTADSRTPHSLDEQEGNGLLTARQQREEEREDASSSEGRRESQESHHFTDRMYNAKEKLEPGQGVYLQPPILDEWKKANVGTLEGDNLNISNENLSAIDRDKAWWETEGRQRSGSMSSRVKKAEAFEGEYDDANVPSRFKPNLYLKCGPLLRYCGIRTDQGAARPGRGAAQKRQIWRGTVMIVTRDNDSSYDIVPTLRLFAQPIELLPPPPSEIAGNQALAPEYIDPLVGHTKVGRRGETLYVRPVEHLEEGKDVSRDESDEGLFEKTRSPPDYPVEDGSEPPGAFNSRRKRIEIDGERVGKYTEVRGFRLHAERGCTFWRFNIEVELRDKQQRIAYRINRGPATAFWVPAKDAAMNIMFHSCNGFSLSVNPNDFSGPDPMWRDVLNTHQTRPFHVMIGGGDQIYNDAVQMETEHFQDWLMERNIHTKVHTPFSPEMQEELEEFYLERYCMWFSQGLFSLANSQIPMVNMFDDHDIIDGFGSYPHHFMNCPVFSGLGNVAFKYYMLFQHQTVLDETEVSESSWIMGSEPGPYINSHSRSMFTMLGARTALLAVDCRTERTRESVVTKKTWEKIMDRCYVEIEKGTMDHILVLLGVPVAYPRLVWLENILTSRLMDPVKALGKTGLFGKLLNSLDGGVEVLDDLDDHWTAKSHKAERTIVVQDLQDLAADKSVRVSILSGDVHLAAIGQFFSNPKQQLSKHKDFRYMPNIISSAIVNTPPPDLLADILNKRNKIHHFDKDTEESMIPLFQHGVDGKTRNNKHLLPHRNWCSIRTYVPGNSPPTTPSNEPEEPSIGTPPVTAVSHGTGGLLRRLSKRGRAPGSIKEKGDKPRPPISNSGGLFRSFSRRASTDDGVRPDLESAPKPKRTMSLTRGDLGSIFGSLRRKKKSPDDGGINGVWGEDEDSYDSFEEDEQEALVQAQQEYTARQSSGYHDFSRSQPRPGIRGGGHATPEREYQMEYEEGDDSYFTVRPNRTKSRHQSRTHHSFGHHYGEPSSPAEALHNLKMSTDKTLLSQPTEHGNNSLGRWSYFSRSTHHGQQASIVGTESHASRDSLPPHSLGQGNNLMPPIRSSTVSGGEFVPRPFHRTPTGMSEKHIKKMGRDRVEVNLESALEVTINVEINKKDPSGITVPYRLLVPKLWYEYEGEERAKEKVGGIGRWLSFKRRSRSDQESSSESDEVDERVG